MRLVLFDCDGTLADSFGLICETMRCCFTTAGLPEPDDAATRGIIGLSLDLAIQQLAPSLTADRLPELVDIYRTEFHRIRAEGGFAERLFAGIDPLLRKLAARDDVLVGMVTGKSQRGVRLVVETHKLDGIFLAVRTADDCPSKPHPDMVLECCAELGISPDRTVVVGDAVYDMQMARAAGAEAFGVAWGAQSSASLLVAGAGQVAASVDDLDTALGAWISQPIRQREIGVANV